MVKQKKQQVSGKVFHWKAARRYL